MSSQYPHLYHEVEKIEENRMKSDLLYRVLMDPDTTVLQKTVETFAARLKKKHGSATRFTQMLSVTCTDSNRLLKHSLIFFSLYREPWALKHFMENNACPPDKISRFVSGELKTCCEDLLRGSYTSMQAFVEDVRWNYVVL